MRIFNFCFLLFCLPAKLYTQEIQISSAIFPPDQQFSIFISMAQDQNGYLWIVDNNGKLLKYDGKNIDAYTPKKNDENSLRPGRGECIFADKSGNIWYGGFANGLDRLNIETGIITHYTHDNNDPNSIISSSIRAILEDSDGMIWIGTLNGIDRYDPATKKFVHIKNQGAEAIALSKEHVRAIYQDKAGAIWVGCGSTFSNETPKEGAGGLYKINKKTDEITRYINIKDDNSSLTDNKVRAIFEDSRGTFWVGTAGDGLHIMDRKTGKFKRYPYDPKNPHKLSRPPIGNSIAYSEDFITFINEDNMGCIWIGTLGNGLNRYNPKTDSVQHYGPNEKEPYRISNNEFWCSLKTKDNLLWVSSWGSNSNEKLLFKIGHPKTKLPFIHTNCAVHSFIQVKKWELWLGTNQGLILRKNTGSEETFLINSDNSGQPTTIESIDIGENNDIWLGSVKGLYQFDRITKKINTFRHDPKNIHSLASDSITGGTLIDQSGKIWVGTFRGLDMLDVNKGIFKHYVLEEEESEISNGVVLTLENTDNRIQALLKDSKNDVWVGLRNTLQKFDRKTAKFKTYINSNARVNSMYEDKSKNIWIGTVQGLYLYNPLKDQVELYYDDSGLISDITSIWGMAADRNGNLWLIVGYGIIKLNPVTKNTVLFGRNWGVDFTNLNNKCYTTLENEITIGAQNGYFHFSPKDISIVKESTPEPLFNKFILGKETLISGSEILPLPLAQTKIITLPYNKNSFTIEFNYIDFINYPDQKIILYKLENYDENWRKSETENRAIYNNLKVGEYLFKVKAVNILGEWGEKTLKIIILPPWYKTWWAYLIFILIGGSILRAYISFRSKKLITENKLLEEKIDERTKQLKKSLDDLKSTQSQLIQSEKMASLGELTAGIAHEIQNPLNFVNNFSEVSEELMVEMVDEVDKGNFDEVKAIAKDVQQNLEKINHHGKRASSIVKGMLEHSRKSSGTKEPTDINALADEYLRLAYHGLRAKDQDFNATMETHFDPNLPKLDIIPQDIGRVLLNLINNAFYAVNERSKKVEIGYEPKVTVTTQLTANSQLLIAIKDNGSGIPDVIKDKIFQPFFTTKPTGQGTGLGLSLAYDIVKAHGGELRVETKEGEYTKFKIELPV